MNTVIGGSSAIEYWFLHSLSSSVVPERPQPVVERLSSLGLCRSRTTLHDVGAPADSVLEDYLHGPLAGLSRPLSLIVPDSRDRRPTALKSCIVWGRRFVPGSLVGIAPRLYVCLPEAAFHQIAFRLGDVDVVLCATSLCAAYVRSATDTRGFRGCLPLTAPNQLGAYLQKASCGPRSHERLRRLLGYVAARSASPMETVLAALLVLPRTLGGYQLKVPEMNATVEVPGEPLWNGLPTTLRLRPDMFWKTQKVIVEYDSDAQHTGGDRIAKDAQRRNLLLSQGYQVFTVTKQQAYDAIAFDRVAHQVRGALGVRERPPAFDWESRRAALRAQLLAPALGMWSCSL